MTKLLLTISLLLTLGQVSSSDILGTADNSVTKEEIEGFIQFLIQDGTLKTTDYLKAEPIKVSPDKLFDELEKNSRIRTKKDSTLFREFREDLPTIMTMYEELDNFKFKTKRLGFRKGKKEKYTSISLPYFNPKKDKVLIEITESCPGLCGSGRIILFERDNGKWTYRHRKMWLV